MGVTNPRPKFPSSLHVMIQPKEVMRANNIDWHDDRQNIKSKVRGYLDWTIKHFVP